MMPGGLPEHYAMLRGKCALITGSTSGLGLAIANRLAGEGCNMVLNGLAADDDVKILLDDLTRKHRIGAVYHAANLTDAAQIADMMRFAAVTFGRVDVLINNAVVRHSARIEEFPVECWNQALAVNLSAAFHSVRLALPAMREQDWGRIVNVASVYSFFATPNRVGYVTTKTALLGLTRSVALETAGTGITCNAVCPGTLPTSAIESRIQGIAAEQKIPLEQARAEYLAARQPGGRYIPMETVTGLIAFLCGPTSAGINGAALTVDSGWTVS